MSIFSDVERTIEREFHRWTAKAFGPADSNSLLLVHHGVLEEVSRKIQTGVRGKRFFPFNHIVVRLSSADEVQQSLFDVTLASQARLESDVREFLTAAGCEAPANFAVEVEGAGTASKPFEVVCSRRVDPPAPVIKSGRARLVVAHGKAGQESFLLNKPRTNIGRLPELTDAKQRVVRRNDIVFDDGSDEANATVSRSHAHIRLDAETGEYRICDDASEYGTRIFRDGRSIEVPSVGRRGERLNPGDEIYLGRACLRFEIS